MQQVYTRKTQVFPHPFLLPLILLGLVFAGRASVGTAYATSSGKEYLACPAAGSITSQSLLVVLLDRSGSLILQPGATDPDGYSTSVTKALADLWPGSMAVIPFSGDTTTSVLGPFAPSDPVQREKLKNDIQQYPIGGNTPLAPALHQALDLLKGAPAGSRAVIVTDGSPEPPVLNGLNQADDIRTNLIHQFCAQGIPVSAFGLTLDLTQQDGRTANSLLTDIATGTGGIYTNVKNSRDLAQVVIKLYADWQHLIFLPATVQGDNYTVSIDTYAKRVAFVTFRTDSPFKITLNGPNKQPVPDQAIEQRSTDLHYEIDSLVVSDVNQPGPYTVNTDGDTNAQVYALIETRLHARLNKPTTQTIAYIGQPLDIEAELFNDNTPVNPQPNEATMIARVTTLVHGQVVSSSDVELVQMSGSPLFTRQIRLPGPTGQVHIEIRASYLQIPVEASEAQVTIPLEVQPVRQFVQLCGFDLHCYWQRYHTQILISVPLALLLLLLAFLLLQKGPQGWSLKQAGHTQDLGQMKRPFTRWLLHKSVVGAEELESHGGFDFHGAKFDLVFRGGASIKARSDEPRIRVKKGSQYEDVKRENKDGVDLADKDIIDVHKCAPAILLDSTVD